MSMAIALCDLALRLVHFMPFTPTHILAILPLAKAFRMLPFSALAIGAIVPDFPLFFPIFSYSSTHSASGVLTHCIPLGIISYFLFHNLLKNSLLAVLPTNFQRRLVLYSNRLPHRKARNLVLVTIAVVLGASTHLLWDAFSHHGRWGTELLPVLNQEIHILGCSIHGYKMLQYGSTLIGLPLLFLLGGMKLKNTKLGSVDRVFKISEKTRFRFFLTLTVPPILAAVYALSLGSNLADTVGVTLKLGGALFIVSSILISLIIQVFLATGDKQP